MGKKGKKKKNYFHKGLSLAFINGYTFLSILRYIYIKHLRNHRNRYL